MECLAVHVVQWVAAAPVDIQDQADRELLLAHKHLPRGQVVVVVAAVEFSPTPVAVAVELAY